jgi:hypothetical protein
MDDDSFDDMLFGVLSSTSSSQKSLIADTDDFDDILQSPRASHTTFFPSDDDTLANITAIYPDRVPEEAQGVNHLTNDTSSKCQELSIVTTKAAPATRDRHARLV